MILRANILYVIFLVTFLGCKPEQEATSFNALISVPIGEDLSLETLEDQPISISYDVSSVDSINLEIFIQTNPSNGKLEGCTKATDNSFQCTYTPNKDFNGVDTFKIKTKDGDLISNESSTISVRVHPVNDGPTAYNGSTSGKENETISFSIPLAKDIDTSANNLTYTIASEPTNGSLSNCLDGIGTRTCDYTANQGVRGIDSLTYRVQDSDGLISNTATFEILVNDPNYSQGLETFTQGVSQIDFVEIIWVIDNSGSMGGEQATLKQNFTSFISNFLDNGKAKFPFNMGVITSDTYSSGYADQAFARDANNNPYNLTSQQAETNFQTFKSDFEKAVLVGTSGSGSEKMFSSIEKSRQYNPSWYSSTDSLLVYILLTDEKEQSYSSSSVNSQIKSDSDVLGWFNLFNTWKQASNRIKLYPIIDLAHNNYDRFGEIARLSGTQVYNIREPFNNILDDISTAVSNLVYSFPLAENIIITESSIKVFVDNVEVSSSTYVFGNNAIKFVTAPTGGSTIKVTYEYY
jgi:hypothetical protein